MQSSTPNSPSTSRSVLGTPTKRASVSGPSAAARLHSRRLLSPTNSTRTIGKLGRASSMTTASPCKNSSLGSAGLNWFSLPQTACKSASSGAASNCSTSNTTTSSTTNASSARSTHVATSSSSLLGAGTIGASPAKIKVPVTALNATPSKGKTKQKVKYDRFIPNRDAMDVPSAQFSIARKEPEKKPHGSYMDDVQIAYQEEVAKACGVALDQRILAFSKEAPVAQKDTLRTSWNRPVRPPVYAAGRRKIATTPDRVLDAPGLVDDYYLNLLEWSSQNIVAVALDSTVYLWNAETGDVSEFCSMGESENVSSLAWSVDGHYLAIGTTLGDTQIWDIVENKKKRSMSGHAARVGVLSWGPELLSSGCRDGSIWHHDVRVRDHKVMEMHGHTGEVCGLKWRPDGLCLASGGNDNLVNIWDAKSSQPKFQKADHQAAVKAIAWCPWQQNLLATGGGSYDRMINFWNTNTGAKISNIDTGSQVTSIVWSLEYKELSSTHGYPHNQVSVWHYPSLKKVADLEGHEARILHSTLSPDGTTVATGGSDESLRFWKVWEERAKTKKNDKLDSTVAGFGGLEELNSSYSRMSIR